LAALSRNSDSIANGLLKLRDFLFDFFSIFCYNIYTRKGEIRMLDDFIMNFSWEELEDEYYTIEDLENDYLTKEEN
jgi:hypothetical protein